MKFLNLACGAVRPQSEEWTNLDDLHFNLLEGTPERRNLDLEKNYVNHEIVRRHASGIRYSSFVNKLPFDDNNFDGILCSHFIEHISCLEASVLMHECRRVLKPQGILMVSAPDASYFRQVYERDRIENAMELFGEEIFLPDGENTFCGYALWNRYHVAIITETVLWHYFLRAGFHTSAIYIGKSIYPDEVFTKLQSLLNREKFSLVMSAMKSE